VNFCPGDPSVRQIVENVVSFVNMHPELKEKDSADVVRWSLSDAFPCDDKDLESDTEATRQEENRHMTTLAASYRTRIE
jgi:Rap1a immunity proteins